MTKTLYSSKTCEWETPQELYDELNEEFSFTLDPCATPENRKCAVPKHGCYILNGIPNEKEQTK